MAESRVRYPPEYRKQMVELVRSGRSAAPLSRSSRGVTMNDAITHRISGARRRASDPSARGESGATGAGRLAGEQGAFMTLLPGWRMRGLFGSPADGSPWRARRGAASGSCFPGC